MQRGRDEQTPRSSPDRRSSPDAASGLQIPTVTLPKGGGAIRGIGEKFAANPVTGTGSVTIPLPTSPGRSGFGPQLALSYDSGTGNGPFGFGWSLSLPSITRKTDKGLPRYRDDGDGGESEVFILSGAEDLVPALIAQGNSWIREPVAPRALAGQTYDITRYRPRTEGLFARIERWTSRATAADTFWRSISSDNITTWYGKDPASRISDPADSTRIFSWLICERYDDKGNAILYTYVAEDAANVDPAAASEQKRERRAGRYIKRIRYGNRKSRLANPDLTQATWLFEVAFDYDEGHFEAMPTDPGRPAAAQHELVRAAATIPGLPRWASRPDPFSVHRSAFEVRTHRRCRRLLMFHNFAELGPVPCLVGATEFDYRDFDYTHFDRGGLAHADAEKAHRGSTRTASFIQSVTHSGFVREASAPAVVRDGVSYLTYRRRSMPPVEFEYSRATVQGDVRDVDPGSLENLPAGADGSIYQFVDLDSEGVSGILTQQAEAWFYKPPLGNGRFGPAAVVPTTPSTASLAAGDQLLDLAGDGQLELVSFSGPSPGFFERTHERKWAPFRTFPSRPQIDWDSPNLRLVDLNGDGRADVLITEHDAFIWHPSHGEDGFGPARRTSQPFDEAEGPRLVFADGTQSIYVADMCGDGLGDLVRVRNGDVCYWPNLGYGRFGARVTMDDAPWFDRPEQFDQRRVRLADIDGSGTTDIIYLGGDGVRLYFNQAGNRWSAAHALAGFPPIDNLASVTAADLLGNGTACLVWSSPLPDGARRAVRYVDLMGGQKPHLLVRTANNLGAETVVHYASSTRFYLDDKAHGRPWITRLPFPVHVVERVETFDHVSRNHFVTRYAYHHGYFDGVEREFRSFGMVEQWDTEVFATLDGGVPRPAGANQDVASHVPPVHTMTWFHTGAYLEGEEISRFFAGLAGAAHGDEYYREPAWRDDDDEARRRLLPDTLLPEGLTLDEEREACRALRGSMLRQEVYGRDGTPKADHPYTVTEQSYIVERLQPRRDSQHGVFITHPAESLTHHYERNPADPRTGHTLTLETNAFGQVTKAVAIAYGRRTADGLPLPSDRARQTSPLLTCTESDFTAALLDKGDDYRVPLPAETRTYELTGCVATGTGKRFTAGDFVERDATDATGRKRIAIVDRELDYEQAASGGKERRVIERVRILYRTNDLTALSPLNTVESLALPGETYSLAFTKGLVPGVFKRPLDLLRPPGAPPPEDLLPTPASVLARTRPDGGGYVDLDGDGRWWVPSGRIFFSSDPAAIPRVESDAAAAHFYLPRRFRDGFGSTTAVAYDDYDLLVLETSDAVGSRVTVGVRKADGSIDAAVKGHDYRVLQPRVVTDPNRNRTTVAFDGLGMVVGTAVSGKDDTVGDTLAGFEADLTRSEIDELYASADPRVVAAAQLKNATARSVYDLDRFRRSRLADPGAETKWTPVYAATIARETHASDPPPPHGLRIQVAFSYSDGFGREIQKKIPAEPGPLVPGGPTVSPRWVGSGWTVYNNKGNPVRQYEPFFSQLAARRHHFEFGVLTGVSPVLFYDPAGRVVATLHPNHTYEKVVFDPWQQRTFDVNDTVAPQGVETGDPRTDRDIKGYVAEYFKTQGPWDPWFQQRITAARGTAEQTAATRAAAHANTPATAHTDALGRTFLTLAQNGRKADGTPLLFATRVELDIEGNTLAVRDPIEQDADPRGRLVMRYRYDMLGNRIHQASMESGERWVLPDAAGKAVRTWDTGGRAVRNEYDALRRPIATLVRGIDPASLATEVTTERVLYGDRHPEGEVRNLRGRPCLHLDQAGAAVTAAHDFKGNVLQAERRLAREFKQHVDWSGVAAAFATNADGKVNMATIDAALAPLLEAEAFVTRTLYDALNRAVQLMPPRRAAPAGRRNVIQPVFNDAGLLEGIDVWLDAAEPAGLLDAAAVAPSPVGVANIDYDAKGQRLLIEYKNGAQTRYAYDAETFRLRDLYTRRGAAFAGDCDNPVPPPPTMAAPETPPAGQPCGLQRLHYTYDPIGNVTEIRDDAQQAVYFQNKRVEPAADYTYDALYRLIAATGREHLGQIGGAPIPYTHDDGKRIGVDLASSDRKAMATYVEEYEYDAAGNLRAISHRGTDPAHAGWTRSFTGDEPSQIEERKRNNRLSRTMPGGAAAVAERYAHDAHGNVVRMPHLENHADPLAGNLHWDFKDQLRRVDLGGGGTAWFVYDRLGQRTRKLWQKPDGTVEERIYLGGFEVFRRTNGAAVVTLERETLHVMDDTRRVAVVETRTAGMDAVPPRLIRYQLGNHLGSASLELDDGAGIVSYEEYSPYGTTTFQAVRSQTETPKRYRYTGKERDEESGFYYHGARYYAPWVGRWVSCDPKGTIDGVNVYEFCRGNPVTFTDPTGTETSSLKRRVDAAFRRDLNLGADRSLSRTQAKPTVDVITPQAKTALQQPPAPAVVDPRCRPLTGGTPMPSAPVQADPPPGADPSLPKLSVEIGEVGNKVTIDATDPSVSYNRFGGGESVTFKGGTDLSAETKRKEGTTKVTWDYSSKLTLEATFPAGRGNQFSLSADTLGEFHLKLTHGTPADFPSHQDLQEGVDATSKGLDGIGKYNSNLLRNAPDMATNEPTSGIPKGIKPITKLLPKQDDAAKDDAAAKPASDEPEGPKPLKPAWTLDIYGKPYTIKDFTGADVNAYQLGLSFGHTF